MANIITAFSPQKLLSDLLIDEDPTSSVVFNKVSQLVHINAKSMILPMKFLDDLNLSSSVLLTKNYEVSHKMNAQRISEGNYVHYTFKKRECKT